jgi:hypothetical protein
VLRYAIPLLVLVAAAPAGSAALIPYYRMDSLAFLSLHVALCEEGEVVKKKKSRYPGGVEHEYHEARFTVVRSFKGGARPGEQIKLDLGLIYSRRLADEGDAPPEKQTHIPKGRALLFLNYTEDTWHLVTGGMKLIVGKEVYCYGQFVENPGGLYLARMAPENIEVEASQPYGEDLLLKDLVLALEKAKGLKEAKRLYAHDKSIVRPGPGLPIGGGK